MIMRDSEHHDRGIRDLRKEIEALEQIARRGGMTLVMKDDALITAYHEGRRGKR